MGLGAQVIQQRLRPRDHHVLGPFAQGDFDQHGRLHVDPHQVGHQPGHFAERPGRAATGLREHFLDTRAEPLVAFLQFLQDRRTFGHRRAPLVQLAQLGLAVG
jgi:hypothetical protein